MDEPNGGSVTYGPGTLVCAAPPSAGMRVSFFDAGGRLIGTEAVDAGGVRVIAPHGVSFSVEILPGAVPASIRDWLERQADHYMQSGSWTSDIPLGVTGFGTRGGALVPHLSADTLYGRYKPGPIVFYAVWRGTEITTERAR